MLRPYNGKLYSRGKVLTKTVEKPVEGDTVRFDLDCDAGTISVHLNGKDLGVCFSGLQGQTIYPGMRRKIPTI